jgi:phage/plasmid-like protein (TIGR03299 family)
MSHDLTVRTNGLVEMAWQGATPWHGLGQEVSAGASLTEWRLAAGMEWELKRADVEFQPEGIRHGMAAAQGLWHGTSSQSWRFARRQVLYRSDTHEGLGVVSSRYREVQPRQVMDFFDRFLDRQGFAMSAVGTMRKGAVLWATAQTGNSGMLPGDDEVKQYVLLSTSCDGTRSTEVRLTHVRVVCANTLSMAQKEKPSVKVRHHLRFDADHVHQSLAEMELGNLQMPFDEFMATARRLATRQVSVAQSKDYLTAVAARMRSGFMSPHFDPVQSLAEPATTDQRQKLQKGDAFRAMMALFDGEGRGANLQSSRGTAWGLINAVTEYVDHHNKGRRQNPADRYFSAWLGRGNALKQEALAMAQLL